MPPVLYDGQELADAIGATYDDVMSWARRGIIPRIKTGRRVVFNLDRVIEALMARDPRVEPAPAGSESR